MNKILVVEDDLYIGNLLEETLTAQGYDVYRSYSGTETLLTIPHVKPNLVLLDLMLPGLNGEEVLPFIKDIPVIVLSAKGDIDAKVSLLLDGAVDYITKPFNMKELLARITVQLRTSIIPNTDTLLTFDDIVMNVTMHIVTVHDTPVKLTKTEYAILKRLLQNPKQILTKSILLDYISIDTPDCTEDSLKIHISNLRKKLREVSGKDYIEAVWGIGFKLKL